jgi:hypothetical protein
MSCKSRVKENYFTIEVFQVRERAWHKGDREDIRLRIF